MLLTIDIGNTNTVLGIHCGKDLKAHWRLTTRREQTVDEYAVLTRSLFAEAGLSASQLTGVVLASVVPPLTPVLAALSRRYWHQEPLVVGPGIKTGMPIRYEPASDVGADRIVNAVAAYALCGGPVVVVDFGTATTFDVVSRTGEYLGGVICPGIGISADALFQRTARLPKVEVRRPDRVIGQSTVGSIQSGLYFGYAAMVTGLVNRIASELGEPARVIATGGWAETLAEEMPGIERIDPVLTLTGLRIVWERNRPEGER